MAGFRGWYKNDLEGQVASFLAGVDILLWPSYEYMDTVEVRFNVVKFQWNGWTMLFAVFGQ